MTDKNKIFSIVLKEYKKEVDKIEKLEFSKREALSNKIYENIINNDNELIEIENDIKKWIDQKIKIDFL